MNRIMSKISDIRNGHYSASYFNKTKEALLKSGNQESVLMQVFCKGEYVFAGIKEVLLLISEATGIHIDVYEKEHSTKNNHSRRMWQSHHQKLKIKCINEGSITRPWEAVLTIEGPYVYFAHLESLILGILSRATKVATNIRKCKEAAGDKPIAFFADRFDRFENQEADGEAAILGGAHSVCTDAMGRSSSTGTMPHSLIAVHKGNLIVALNSLKEIQSNYLVALVDFNNNCVSESLMAAKTFGENLYAVRLDTSEMLTDTYFVNESQEVQDKNKGVSISLVKAVRKALNDNGYNKVQICVSGGFNPAKIKRFEDDFTPVDIYGVGSSALNHNGMNFDFTADIVMVDGEHMAKTGRKYTPDSRLR